MNYTTDIDRCLHTLQNGGVILYPTDTIWGLGADPTNGEAVSKIYSLKKRSEKKSMIILVAAIDEIGLFAKRPSLLVTKMIEDAERPLTVIFPDAKNLASNLVNEDGTIAVRVAKDDFCRELITAFGKPLVSTSANISNEKSPENFNDISDQIRSGADYIVQYRQDENKKSSPSRIIKWIDDDHIVVIRD